MHRSRPGPAVSPILVGVLTWSAVILGLWATRPSCLQAQSAAARLARAVDAGVIRAHLNFLSDDLLEGRAPATRGGDLAAIYIAAQFRRLALEPAGDDGTYFQEVPLVTHATVEATLHAVADTQPLTYPADYVLWSEGPDSVTELTAGPIFVGYGIIAPAYHWDDYKGTSVRGRIVVALAGDPDSTRFDRYTGMPYGGWRYKVDEAARQGAAGVLLIHTAEAGFPWSAAVGFARPLTNNRKPPASTRVLGWLSEPAAAELLSREGVDLSALKDQAARPEFQPLALQARFSLRVTTRIRQWATRNVVARLPGRGSRQREGVVIGAHYDHLGIGPAVDGDSIYNGAEDNASGSAGVLAGAEAFRRSGITPLRSIYFVAFGAEERGLLGSQAFVAHPPVPRQDLVAAIALDVMNLWGRTRDIGTVAPDLSTMGATLRSAARAETLRVTIDPDDVHRHRLLRSDNFSFLQMGIPALRLLSGLDYEGRPPEWGRAQKDTMWATRYHTPADDVKGWYTTEGTAQQVRVLVRLALLIANDPARPRWAPGSTFQAAPDPGAGRSP
jgi:hypothetical protein